MSPTPDAPLPTASEGAVSTSSVHLDTNATSAEVGWLRRCLPIFVQPDVDIKNHNDLVKVFFRFERNDETGHLVCKLCIVFAGESSYNRVQEEIENSLATLCYRTFNRRTYKRTADINYMEFRNVNLNPDAAVPWASIFSTDHGGKQQWAQGEKKNLGNWFSLMHHYNAEIAHSDWKLHPQTHRPYIYLNTCNHMIGEKDNNPKLSDKKHDTEEVGEVTLLESKLVGPVNLVASSSRTFIHVVHISSTEIGACSNSQPI
eukprot:jgi/Phyca11/535918/estExt2_fgenesh1_pg.C_PHYCAscaffold_430073